MVMVLVAKNKVYQNLLAEALRPLDCALCLCTGIDDFSLPDDKIELLIVVLDGFNSQKFLKISQKTPVFAILTAENDLKTDEKGEFAGIFAPFVRLGRVTDAVRAYKKQKQLVNNLLPVKMGQYTLDPKHSTFDRGKSSACISLTEKEQSILLYLYKNKGCSIGKNRLLDHVWGYAQGVETHTLETHIYRLRQKIEQDSSRPVFLMTDDDGYYLNLEVEI